MVHDLTFSGRKTSNVLKSDQLRFVPRGKNIFCPWSLNDSCLSHHSLESQGIRTQVLGLGWDEVESGANAKRRGRCDERKPYHGKCPAGKVEWW